MEAILNRQRHGLRSVSKLFVSQKSLRQNVGHKYLVMKETSPHVASDPALHRNKLQSGVLPRKCNAEHRSMGNLASHYMKSLRNGKTDAKVLDAILPLKLSVLVVKIAVYEQSICMIRLRLLS